MESGMLYIAAVIVLVAAGFIYALGMSLFAIREADRGWPQGATPTVLSYEAAHAEALVLVSTAEETTSQIAR